MRIVKRRSFKCEGRYHSSGSNQESTSDLIKLNYVLLRQQHPLLIGYLFIHFCVANSILFHLPLENFYYAAVYCCVCVCIFIETSCEHVTFNFGWISSRKIALRIVSLKERVGISITKWDTSLFCASITTYRAVVFVEVIVILATVHIFWNQNWGVTIDTIYSGVKLLVNNPVNLH